MKHFSSLCLYFVFFQCFANPYEVFYRKWYFGDQAGIDFHNVNSPVSFTTNASSTYDYGSGICDFGGNTLFYTNGETVWNKNNVVMSNGTNLNGSVTGGQTALILRVYSEDNLYYIFTVAEFASSNGFRYSVVDMSLQGGLGEVVEKNHLLFAPSTEKLSAVYNPLNNSYWIIAHQWGNNTFAVYNLSTLGLDTIPVLSNVGHINAGGTYGGAHDACGEMSVSPDGNRIACAYYLSQIFELYDFDILTGTVSNPVTITNVPHIWGIEFSPDSKKLYTSLWTQTEVAQYDISSNNSAVIAASKFVAGNVPFSGSYACGYLELAPNGVLYIAKWNGTDLSQISYPDSLGSACGFTNSGFSLSVGISQCGLSPSPVFPTNSAKSTGSINKNTFALSIFPNPVQNGFNVKIPDGLEFHDCSFELLNMESRIILSALFTSREIYFRRENIPPGNYIGILKRKGEMIGEEKIVLK